MRRFPLPRGGKSALIAERTNLRVAGRRIAGYFDWPHDPIFRPLVGIFTDGRLEHVAPSFRRPLPNRGPWPCYLSITLPKRLAETAAVTIACLETGDVLHPRWNDDSSLPLRVEDLIAEGRRATRGQVLDGFTAFLLLPLSDQIDILYRDLLGRGANARDVAHYRTRIAKGEIAILDARDEISTSEEALNANRHLTLDDRRGRMCVWPGLEATLMHLVPPVFAPRDAGLIDAPSSLRSAFDEIAVPETVGGVLARNAVGPTTHVELYERWVERHHLAVAPIEARLARRPRGLTRRCAYRFGNLLTAMSPGPIAMREPSSIISAHSGNAGTIAYGPYVHLESGSYRVSCRLRIQAPSAVASDLSLEVVHGDILLARRDLKVAREWHETLGLNFAVPQRLKELVGTPAIEFRIRGDGNAAAHVEEVALEALPDGCADARTMDDWLPALIPGGAGSRTEDGRIVAQTSSGHVFYGPYCTLMPGAYRFMLECDLAEAAANGEVELEAVTANNEVLARQQVMLSAGANRLEIGFGIPWVHDPNMLSGPLEFRLWKAEGFTFRCRAAQLEALGEDQTDPLYHLGNETDDRSR